MESWRIVFRKSLVLLLSDEALEALRNGLETDDPRLIQGATTTPPPLQCCAGWPVEAACAIGYCGWMGEGLNTVVEVEEWFARMCFEIDQRLGEPAGCRWWLNHWDDTPRHKLFPVVLDEVNLAIRCRKNMREYDANHCQR